MPCIAQWMITFKERGVKESTIISVLVLGVAFLVAGALNALLGACPWILGS
jgi:hypothetical protein